MGVAVRDSNRQVKQEKHSLILRNKPSGRSAHASFYKARTLQPGDVRARITFARRALCTLFHLGAGYNGLGAGYMARSEAQKAAERNYEKKRGPRKRKRIDKRGKRDRTSDQRDRRSRKAAQPSLAGALEAVAAAAVAAVAAIDHEWL